MTRVFFRRLWLLVLLLAGARPALAVDVAAPDLLAHGDEQRFWVAGVRQLGTTSDSQQTWVVFRTNGQENRWQVLTGTAIAGRGISLASQGGQSAVLMDDGSWVLLSTDGRPFTAGPLPPPARMVALAGGRTTWWAVGVTPGGMASVTTRPAASTSPATTTAAVAVAATVPATLPAGSRLVLFRLAGNEWTAVSEWPYDVTPTPSVSLALVDEAPHVAALDAAGTLRVQRLAGSEWRPDLPPLHPEALANFKLLPDNTVARLLLQQQTGPDLLYVFGPHPSAPFPLQPIAGSTPLHRAVTIATGKIRMIAQVKGDFVEQDFSIANGQPDGKPYTLRLPEQSPLGDWQSLQSLIVIIALAIAVFGSMRQRSGLRQAAVKLDEVNLAPLGRRLAAGLIDLSPVILAMAAMAVNLDAAHAPYDPAAATKLLLVYWAGALFYVFYMTLIETLGGRSLGKVALGLRVIGLDGQPARQGALLTRNMLRLIDVGVFFLPLLIVLMLPSRQRAGDMAAGTLVVSGSKPIREPIDSQQATQEIEAQP